MELGKDEFMRHTAVQVMGDLFLVLSSLPAESADDYDAFKDAVRLKLGLGRDYWKSAGAQSPRHPLLARRTGNQGEQGAAGWD